MDMRKAVSVVLCRWEEGLCFEESQMTVHPEDPSTYGFRWEDLITVAVETAALKGGNYSVRVDSVSTPFFKLTDDNHSLLTLPLSVSVIIFATSVAILAIIYYGHKKLFRSSSGQEQEKPSVLLVYDSKICRSDYMEALGVFLQRHGGVKVLLDVVDIPRTQHKDPFIWYGQAVDQADLVAVYIGPSPDTSGAVFEGGGATIYQRTFDLALDLLATRIKRRLESCPGVSAVDGCVVLRGADEVDKKYLPQLVRPLKRFELPIHFRDLIRYVHKGRAAPPSAHWSKSQLVGAFHLICQQVEREKEASRAAEKVAGVTAESRSLLTDSSPLPTRDEKELIYLEEKEAALKEAFGSFPPSVIDIVDETDDEDVDEEARQWPSQQLQVAPALDKLNLF